ncbi:MAG: DNRLRE domain-containing protein [Candidatus Hodarchaeota archaeon]
MKKFNKISRKGQRRLIFISVIAVIVFFIWAISLRQIVYGYILNINVDKDAYVYEFDPDQNYGADEHLFVGNYHLGRTESYYHFDVSSLPNGWTEAIIVVYFDYGIGTVNVGANITHDTWDEMTITWNNKPQQGKYRGYIINDGFDFSIPLKPENFTNEEVTICLYGRGGINDGYIQGNSREGGSDPFIRLSYDQLDPIVLNSIIVGTIMIVIVIAIFIYLELKKPSKLVAPMLFNIGGSNHNLSKPNFTMEKKVNEYITLRLEFGKTFIYVNNRRFIQCIRLILNIPMDNVPLYDEIESIDEAAKIYGRHIWQNMIVRGPGAIPETDQHHKITPEQEFWGHCSNIQAWVEHDYDTRILMANISFPLLRELTKAGDPKAKIIYKEEIALRLESGYPSVVQYLLAQRYLEIFNPEELQTILETTDIIKNLSSEPNLLSEFLHFCSNKFPTLLEIILLQILKLPKGKKIFYLTITVKHKTIPTRIYTLTNRPPFLLSVKAALENLFPRVDHKMGEVIIDCIQVVNARLVGLDMITPEQSRKSFLEAYFKDMPIENLVNLTEEEKILFKQMTLQKIRSYLSRCLYCGKVIPKGKDVCDWCGHKKDDDDEGFFPYPYIFKPPGGGPTKGTVVVRPKIKN